MKRRELLQLSALAATGMVLPRSAHAQDVEGERLAKVERLLSGLTLDEKIGQMMMSYPPLDKTGPVPVGSVIFLGNLLKSEAPVVERIESLQARSKIPLLIAADVEGGKLNKLSFLPGLESVPSNRALAAEGEAAAREWGRKVGAGMLRLGINMALAPVLDVAGSGMMYDSERSFGADPAVAAKLGQAYSQGLSEGGVVAVGKHWPGYGDLDENTDHHFVVTSRSTSEVERQSKAFVGCGQAIAGVMLANVGYDSYGSVPAILSEELVRSAHRQGWLAITDDLAIDALAEATGGDKEEVVRRAFLAGNDILLTTAPIDWDQALDYRGLVRELVDARPELVAQVDDSVHRILRVKARAGLLD